MGLISSGDEYNRRCDAALGDIPRTYKVAGDILAYDLSYSAHLENVWNILQRCDDHGMALNPDKCSFAGNEVEFCGFKTNQTGYTATTRSCEPWRSFRSRRALRTLDRFSVS